MRVHLPWNLVSYPAINFLPPAVKAPVHRFSRPIPTFEAHDAGDSAPSSSLDGLKIIEDVPSLIDQSPPSLAPSRSGSPVPPFVISRARAKKVVAILQKDQISTSPGESEIVPAGQQGRLETSMSLGRIADLLGDICVCLSCSHARVFSTCFHAQGLLLSTSPRTRVSFGISLEWLLGLVWIPQHQSIIPRWVSVLLVSLVPLVPLALLHSPLGWIVVTTVSPQNSQEACHFFAKSH